MIIEIVNGIPQPINVGDKYVKATWFDTAASGTVSGTITKPADNKPEVAFIMDEWGSDTDALVSTMANGKPTFKSPVNASGSIITTTFNLAGEYAFSDTPSPAGDHAVIYVYKCYLKNFDIDESLFESELVDYVREGDSPIFDTVKLSDLTDGYIPKHTSDAAGLENSSIFIDGTKVGIGTEALFGQVTLLGLGQATGNPSTDPDAAQGGTLTLLDEGDTAGAGGMVVFGVGGYGRSGFAAIKGYVDNVNDYTYGHLVFATRDELAYALAERMRITNDGKVGIGVPAPSAKLHLPIGTAAAGTAPFKISSGTLLTAPEAGVIEFDGTGLYFTPTDHRRFISLASDSIITTVTATTVAPTTLWTGITNANELKAHRVYVIKCCGLYTVDDTETATITLTMGGTTVGAITTPVGAIEDGAWYLEVFITVRSTGATGIISAFGKMDASTESNYGVLESFVINTTIANDFVLTCSWSDVGQSLKLTQCWMAEAD